MVCYHPITVWRSLDGRNPRTGKWPITFNKLKGYADLELQVPCGQCVGCRLERSRQWAVRCVHEASLYKNNCFITLTFNDENLDKNKSLKKRDFQLFMKRLRKKYGANIRYYHCGEYGDLNARPHHHAILFNHQFEDQKFWKMSGEYPIYRSADLETLWPFGHSSIGAVSFDSAAYVARYIMKKITGQSATEHYQGRQPEYTTMSRRPGIARDWIQKYLNDVYPHDYLIINNGLKCKSTKYYDKIYDINYPTQLNKLKQKRKEDSKKYILNNTIKRLQTREYIQLKKADLLIRQLP